MQLIEVLLTELAGSGDPGARSSRPEGLEVVVYVRASDGDGDHTACGASVLPPGVQSPWNHPAMAETLDAAVGDLCGTELDLGAGSPPGRLRQILLRFGGHVIAVTDPQRQALAGVETALESGLRSLVAHARGVDGAAGCECGRSSPTVGKEEEPSLHRIVARMGRCAWSRLGVRPNPWGAGGSSNEFESSGLETFGKNSLDSYLLEREARRLGLRTVRFRGVDFQVEDPAGRSFGFHCTTGPSTSRYTVRVCGDKHVTRALLSRAGVSVPEGRVFAASEWADAREYGRSLGWPVVVKPAGGHGGRGVTTGITDEGAMGAAFTALVQEGERQIILERHVRGGDYRLLVVGDRVISVIKRTASGVIGDGRSTVAELVLAKNSARLQNPHLRTRLITFDADALRMLSEQGMTPESVPADGASVALTRVANISRGGESVEVLDETHPSLLEMAVRAVAAVPGLDHAGVDLLAEDHRRPLGEQDTAICELNSLPATTSHHFPAYGPPRNVSQALIEFYVNRYGLVTDPQPERVSVGVRITGRVRAVGYRRWFADLAAQLRVGGWIRRGEADGVVEAELSGSLDHVSALCVQAVFGSFESRPDLVETWVIGTVHSGRFECVPG